jgi:hypothetical protein
MDTSHINSPDFAEGFVGECFKRGFTEEQTSYMLDNAIKIALANSGDQAFLEGFAEANVKAAFALAAPIAGALPPDFRLPGLRSGDEGPMEGTGKGIVGGSLAGLAALALTKGRGLKFLKRMPSMSLGRGARGGVGALLHGGNRPLAAIGEAAMHPATRKFLGRGALTGGLYGLGAGVHNRMSGNYDLMGKYLPAVAGGDSTYVPGTLNAAGGSGGTGGGGGQRDIFSVPTSLKDYWAPRGRASGAYHGGSGGYAGGDGSAGNPVRDTYLGRIRTGQDAMRNLDSELQDLESRKSSLATGDTGDMLESMNVQRRINELNRTRNQHVQSMLSAATSLRGGEQRYHDAAARDYERATRAQSGADRWAKFHMGNIQAMDDGGATNVPRRVLGWLMNSRNRAQEDVTTSRNYRSIAGAAQNAMNSTWTP